MLALRATKLKTFFATLCMALTAVLISQSTIAAVNQFQHGQMADHPGVVFAGQVHFDHDEHDDRQSGHDEQQISTADDASTDGPSHHHHGDGPQLAPLPRGDAASVISAQALSLRGASDAPPHSGTILGLKRPPKATLEVIA